MAVFRAFQYFNEKNDVRGTSLKEELIAQLKEYLGKEYKVSIKNILSEEGLLLFLLACAVEVGNLERVTDILSHVKNKEFYRILSKAVLNKEEFGSEVDNELVAFVKTMQARAEEWNRKEIWKYILSAIQLFHTTQKIPGFTDISTKITRFVKAPEKGSISVLPLKPTKPITAGETQITFGEPQITLKKKPTVPVQKKSGKRSISVVLEPTKPITTGGIQITSKKPITVSVQPVQPKSEKELETIKK